MTKEEAVAALIEAAEEAHADFYAEAFSEVLTRYTQEVERAALERAAKVCQAAERAVLALIPKPSGSRVDVGPETGGEGK